MDKRILIFSFVFILVIAGLVFVFAGSNPPTTLNFSENTTPEYDRDGTFFLNWTAGAGDAASNYTIYVSVDGGTNWFLNAKNDSALGYVFTNITDDANYTFQVSAINETLNESVNSSQLSMIIDTTKPAIAYGLGMAANAANSTTNFIFVNVTATDTYNGTLSFTLYNTTGIVNQTNFTDLYATIEINWTGLSEAVYYYNVTANDSATNTNSTSTYKFTYDVTNPVATLSCSPSSVTTGNTVTCTCSGTDTGGSGINSSAISAATTPSTSSTGTFTVTSCSVTDYAGNSDTASDSYTVTSSGGGSSGTTTLPKKTHSWTKITPGVVTIMKNFDKEIGIKEIQIEVNNEAQNVKITVTKYDGKPAEVSVEKSGKIYKYLHINAENLEGKLSKGVVTIQVEKSWATDNGFETDDIAMFKFNEASEEWDELTTTYTEADDEYYYYDIELDSFSYFAISEKVVVDEGDNGIGDTGTTSDEEERNLTWLWILIGVVVLAIIIGVIKVIKNKQ